MEVKISQKSKVKSQKEGGRKKIKEKKQKSKKVGRKK
jgi:hypothetical protein